MRRLIKLFIITATFIMAITTVPMPAGAVDCYTTTLRQGSTGACVRLAQERLNAYHCNAGPIDGYFGTMTKTATINFQKVNALYADGVIGPTQTWPKLRTSYSKHCPTTNPDNDALDRALCTNSISKCILVHHVGGYNRLELFENKVLVAAVTVNTGMAGYRTRNTTSSSIFRETFATEASEMVTKASYGTSPKQWAPGVRQLYDSNQPGLMGDPHTFNGGQALHWRVKYSTQKDEYGKSLPVILNGLAQENPVYDGTYASHGCVHIPKWFLDKYDSTFFQYGVRVRVQDQPTT